MSLSSNTVYVLIDWCLQPGQIENPFTMTVEEDRGEEMFMPEPPGDLLRVSKNKVPYMMGMNSGEGMMYVDNPSGKQK